MSWRLRGAPYRRSARCWWASDESRRAPPSRPRGAREPVAPTPWSCGRRRCIGRTHLSAALFTHYTAVADASPVPVLLYNYPAFTGVNLAPDLIGRLAEHPNIVGVKETSTDGGQFAEMAAVVPDRFTILSGSAPGCLAALCAGARGAILAVACVAPESCIELMRLTLAGKLAEALLIQQRLMPLARAVTTGFGIAGLKAALDLAGYAGGDPRPPLRPLAADGVENIRTLLEGLHAPVN